MGVVLSFDEKFGAGQISEAVGDSTRTYFFHATKLLDGSRSVEVGALVCFRLHAGGNGRFEATEIAVLSDAWMSRCPVCNDALEGVSQNYEVCVTCGWEDDPVQFDDPTYAGGANESSLNDARIAWAAATRTSENSGDATTNGL